MKKIGILAAAALLALSPVAVYAEESGNTSQVASSDEMAAGVEVVEEWMVPIEGTDVEDGVYEISVISSSPMFNVEKCELTVKDGEMSAIMTMSATGYLYVFPGTGKEAAQASEEDYISFVEDKEGKHTFEIPVDALDAAVDCAAFSKRKEKWYDRQLVFEASSLPADALKNMELVTAESLGLKDGSYTAEAVLQGGSGRSAIESPAEITVENGQAYIEVIFGSANYDYMLVGEEKYEPVNTEGNSTFVIPVTGFDYNMPVIADTIAMSVPHEISYTIKIDSATIKEK